MSGRPNRLPELRIDLDRPRRWRGTLYYLLFTAFVAGTLVWVFVRFTASVGMAVALVAFMLTYMAVMGRLAIGDFGRGQADPDADPPQR